MSSMKTEKVYMTIKNQQDGFWKNSYPTSGLDWICTHENMYYSLVFEVLDRVYLSYILRWKHYYEQYRLYEREESIIKFLRWNVHNSLVLPDLRKNNPPLSSC